MLEIFAPKDFFLLVIVVTSYYQSGSNQCFQKEHFLRICGNIELSDIKFSASSIYSVWALEFGNCGYTHPLYDFFYNYYHLFAFQYN